MRAIENIFAGQLAMGILCSVARVPDTIAEAKDLAELLEHALAYRRRGWSVIPTRNTPGGRRVAACRWTPWQRERLYGEIRRRLAGRRSGTLRRHWGAALHVARRS